jgi:hypothetical protein
MSDQLTDRLSLVMNPDLVIVAREDGKVTYWDTANGGRLAVPAPIAELLERNRDAFAIPPELS